MLRTFRNNVACWFFGHIPIHLVEWHGGPTLEFCDNRGQPRMEFRPCKRCGTVYCHIFDSIKSYTNIINIDELSPFRGRVKHEQDDPTSNGGNHETTSDPQA